MDLENLSLAELTALAAEKQEALDAIFAAVADGASPTDEQVTDAEALSADIEAIAAASEALAAAETDEQAAASARLDKFAAIKAQHAAKEDEGDGNEPEGDEGDEGDGEGDAGDGNEPAEAASDAEVLAAAEAIVAAAAKKNVNTVKRVARKTTRPAAPVVEPTSKVTILASADTGFASGTELDIDSMGVALQNRVRGFAQPTEAQMGADIPMVKVPVASVRFDTPAELTIDHKTSDQMAVLAAAVKEDRLPGGSLIAAGGWCAPSETIYDLCEGETLEGLYSLPEVTVKRGGINYTKGPQFSDFYGTPWTGGAGFKQTEAQAIAGTTKDCYTISCPPFQEVRMDAVGLCIKVPILTEAGYPELIRRITSGSLTAHQHRLSVEKINRVVALSGTAQNYATNGNNVGSMVDDSLAGLTIIANKRREQFRLALNASLEVILPFWVKDMFREDLARRNGVTVETVTDAQIMAHFAARNLAPQFVYGWQPLSGVLTGTQALKYPTTYNALMYPAGTFVAGVADVINMSAVYDAASLQVNVYTGTFMEQGLLVAEMCFDSDLVTLPSACISGRSGAADFTCA